MGFQRARSEEQREIRRQAILDTAAAMLDLMPVSEVTLNELSRRADLAKSNVLRYFESREAILLELLDRAARRWLSELPGQLAAGVPPDGTPRERADQLAVVLARSVAPQRQLCDLLSAQASVLEHNVSADVVARYKPGDVRQPGGPDRTRPGVPARARRRRGVEGVRHASMVFMGALWSYTQHPASVLAAYEADPSLAVLRLDFAAALEEALATLFTGSLARARRAAGPLMRATTVLWDIDGTLLHSGGVAPEAFLEAVAEVTGARPTPEGRDYGGRLDHRDRGDAADGRGRGAGLRRRCARGAAASRARAARRAPGPDQLLSRGRRAAGRAGGGGRPADGGDRQPGRHRPVQAGGGRADPPIELGFGGFGDSAGTRAAVAGRA